MKSFLNWIFISITICLTGVTAFNDERYGHFIHLKVSGEASTQESSVQKLLQRLLGSRAGSFVIRVNPNISIDGRDVFILEKPESSSFVTVTGSSPVAAAWGSHHYLKHYCNCHVSWDGDQLQAFPAGKLPTVNVTVTANDLFRYYQNVCTYGYSFVWWNQTRWTREIDWMALNGYNMALSFVGMETLWKKLYTGYGLTAQEIDQHFSGPAFLPWQRMGNMRGWGGPLNDAWLKRTYDLQIFILSQMRSLGITPVLPAFVGHVPKAFKRIFPDAIFTQTTRWNNFDDDYCCPLMLEPAQPLFSKVSSDFTREKKMIDKIIKEFHMEQSKPTATPMEEGFEITDGEIDSTVSYRRLICSLLYVAVISRPDISSVVSLLSRYLDKPTEQLWNAAKRVVRYLNGTKEMGLRFTKENTNLSGYSDSDWGKDKATRKSISGFVAFHGSNPIAWFSKKQTCVALSTMEAEYLAAAAEAQEIVNLKGVLSEFDSGVEPL